ENAPVSSPGMDDSKRDGDCSVLPRSHRLRRRQEQRGPYTLVPKVVARVAAGRRIAAGVVLERGIADQKHRSLRTQLVTDDADPLFVDEIGQRALKEHIESQRHLPRPKLSGIRANVMLNRKNDEATQ